MSIGEIGEFSPENDDWDSYSERIDMYFAANDISNDRKLPALIASIGRPTYDLLRTLSYPRKPNELTYSDVISLLRSHFNAQPASLIAERYRFRQRRQKEGELVHQYFVALKRLAQKCRFPGSLDDNLLEQFVCGLRSEQIRRQVLRETDLEAAVVLAASLEADERDAAAVSAPQTEKTSRRRSLLPEPASDLGVLQGHSSQIESGSTPEVSALLRLCQACGWPHSSSTCRYRFDVCNNCGKQGHLQRVCSEVVRVARRPRMNRVRRVPVNLEVERTREIRLSGQIYMSD